MRNFRPPFLGDDDWFDWVQTSPGRVNPETGELVESSSVPESKSKEMFDWIETSPGRVDPRTGKLIVSTGVPGKRDGAKRPSTPTGGPGGRSGERAFSRFQGGGGSPRLPFRRPDASRSDSSHEEAVASELADFARRSEAGAQRQPSGGMFDIFEPGMNGPRPKIGCGTCSELGSHENDDGPGIALLLFLGVGAAVALEAIGITSWSKKV